MSDKLKTRPSTAKIPPFGLRLQPALKEALEKAATQNGRSLNAEITARLEASLEGPDALLISSSRDAMPSAGDVTDMRDLLEGIRKEVQLLSHLRSKIENSKR